MKKSLDSFVVYVDESGDEGFSFSDPLRASSDWFVLSAAIFRGSNDHHAVSAMKKARTAINKPTNYTTHFVKLKHEHKRVLASVLSKCPMRTISIVCDKRSLTESEYLQGKHKLYFYSVRLLMERVSWLCRDNRKPSDGEGVARVVFSNRSGMSYDAMRAYLKKLKIQSESRQDIHIEWDQLDVDMIQTTPHNQRAGLQIVDVVASSVYAAFQVSRHGFTEPIYAKTLAPVMYRHRNSAKGYGIKIWPREAIGKLEGDSDYDWVFKGA